MTHPFLYRPAASIDDAAKQLSEPGTVSMGGGTDLLVTIAEEITSPDMVVDLRTIPGNASITEEPDGSVRIGGAARIHDIGRHPVIQSKYNALAEACDVVGTPALRHMGTIGGNLCQRPRCWYFRRGVPCLKNGGDICPAVHGENQYLAILDAGPCYVVHPSDPAVALTALDASIEIASSAGRRTISIGSLYTLPSDRLDTETVLAPGEFVSAILLPKESAGGSQRYHKQMQRDAWDFALVSVAGCKRPDGEIRLVLGGVAPRPYRINSSVEEDVSSGGLDDDTIATLADRALLDAKPMSKNEYKLDLAAALLRRVIGEIA